MAQSTIVYLCVCCAWVACVSGRESDLTDLSPVRSPGTCDAPRGQTRSVEQYVNVRVERQEECCTLCTKASRCVMWKTVPREVTNELLCKMYKSSCNEINGYLKITRRHGKAHCTPNVADTKPVSVFAYDTFETKRTANPDKCCRACARIKRCTVWRWVALKRGKGRCYMHDACVRSKGVVGKSLAKCNEVADRSYTAPIQNVTLMERLVIFLRTRYQYLHPRGLPWIVLINDTFSSKIVKKKKHQCCELCRSNALCDVFEWESVSRSYGKCHMHKSHACVHIAANFKATMAHCDKPDSNLSVELDAVAVKKKSPSRVHGISGQAACCRLCSQKRQCKAWTWFPARGTRGKWGTCTMYETCDEYVATTGFYRVPPATCQCAEDTWTHTIPLSVTFPPAQPKMCWVYEHTKCEDKQRTQLNAYPRVGWWSHDATMPCTSWSTERRCRRASCTWIADRRLCVLSCTSNAQCKENQVCDVRHHGCTHCTGYVNSTLCTEASCIWAMKRKTQRCLAPRRARRWLRRDAQRRKRLYRKQRKRLSCSSDVDCKKARRRGDVCNMRKGLCVRRESN